MLVSPPRQRLLLLLLPFIATILVVGCGEPTPRVDYVARVGDAYLTQQEVENALTGLMPIQDSVGVREQIVERWVTNELLLQEAQRLELHTNDRVQRLLQENERSVLISALVDEMYNREPAEVTQAAVEAFYARNRDNLRLREPYLRLRYVAAAEPDSALAAQGLLRRLPSSEEGDSLWRSRVQRMTDDPGLALAFIRNYYPTSRLFVSQPQLRERVAALDAGQVSAVIETDSLFHVLQIVERIPVGTVPELDWIEQDVREQVLIQSRKQMYQRLVQQLRTQAQAREEFDVRYEP